MNVPKEQVVMKPVYRFESEDKVAEVSVLLVTLQEKQKAANEFKVNNDKEGFQIGNIALFSRDEVTLVLEHRVEAVKAQLRFNGIEVP